MNLEHLGSAGMEPVTLRMQLSQISDVAERARAAGESLDRVHVPELPGGVFTLAAQQRAAELGAVALSHAQWVSDVAIAAEGYSHSVEAIDGDMELIQWAQ